MSKKPTIQDIAKRAGVSPATVSRVMNDYEHVSDKKRQQVQRAIDELAYRPSQVARTLRTQKTRMIGLLTDEIAHSPYAGEIIKGAEEAAWNNEHVLVIMSGGDNPVRAEAAVNALLDREVEYIIYTAVFHHAITVPHNIYHVPVVMANCYVADRSLPSVVPDEFTGGYEATRVAIDKGHKRIGFINVSSVQPTSIPASIGRWTGYQHALAEANIPYEETLVRHGQGEHNSGYELTRELMKEPNPPTVIFAGNDRTAMGVYDALRELHLKIPDDVAVISFDNHEIIATALRPSLSTMQLPHYEMGQWAVEYLIGSTLNSNGKPTQQILHCPYVERASI